MNIKFSSYRDKFRLENALIFATHDEDRIAKIRAIDSRRAEQMESENAEWAVMLRKLSDVLDIEQPIEL